MAKFSDRPVVGMECLHNRSLISNVIALPADKSDTGVFVCRQSNEHTELSVCSVHCARVPSQLFLLKGTVKRYRKTLVNVAPT